MKMSFVVVAIALALGCDRPLPPAAGLSKAPWLDPTLQAEGLKNSDLRIRGLSAYHLGNIGAPAAGALPALEKLAAGDPEPKVREQAQQAVEKIRAAIGD